MVRERGQIRADELIEKLAADPVYQARIAEENLALEERHRRFRADAAPLLDDLTRAGFEVDDISSLRYPGVGNKTALPVLLDWLQRDTSSSIKRSVLLALSGRWAGSTVLAPLMSEFWRIDPDDDKGADSIRSQILLVVDNHANASVVDDLLTIMDDERQGSARKFAALALGKVRSEAERTVPALLRAARGNGEPYLDIYALIALGMLKESGAKPLIEAALEDPDPWVRKKMKQALAKLH